MKVIDEQGRLFGRINIIDFLVIVFLLSLIPMFYFGYQVLTKEPPAQEFLKGEFIVIEVDCRLIKLKPEILKDLSVGDKELNNNGEVIGEIISLGQSGVYKYEFNIGGKELVIEDPTLKQIEARLRLTVAVDNRVLFYKDKEVKIGLPLSFKYNSYVLSAIPIKKEKAARIKERKVDLYVTLKDLEQDAVKLISVGDREVDARGKTIAEVLSLGRMEKSSLEFDLGGGNFVTGEDSSKKQFSAKMRISSQVKADNQLYFKGERIEHNLPIEFKTDRYKVMFKIAKTYEMVSPKPEERWISLQVKLSGLMPEIANVIQKGDLEKNPFEETVAKVNSIISNKPSEVLALRENEFVTLNHPFNKDIILFLDVRCIEKEGVFYFKNYPVKMGNNITFTTDLYSISGLIIGLQMK